MVAQKSKQGVGKWWLSAVMVLGVILATQTMHTPMNHPVDEIEPR